MGRKAGKEGGDVKREWSVLNSKKGPGDILKDMDSRRGGSIFEKKAEASWKNLEQRRGDRSKETGLLEFRAQTAG